VTNGNAGKQTKRKNENEKKEKKNDHGNASKEQICVGE
jgi:hypothetical protein